MNLGILLKDWRYAEKLGVREAAKEVGISASTFNRIERAEKMDGYTLGKIICWLLQKPV